MFCSACHVVASEIRLALNNNSARIKEGVIVSSYTLYKEALVERSRLIGETLPLDHKLSLQNGGGGDFPSERDPYSQDGGLRSPPEKNAFSSISNNHMAEYIPTTLSEEKKRLKKLIEGRPIRLIFDGTTRIGETTEVLYFILIGV